MSSFLSKQKVIDTKQMIKLKLSKRHIGKPVIKKKKNKGRVKEFFSQLSRGLMLPVATLPMAGLLYGIGGALGANLTSDAGQVAANILIGMSSVIFDCLALLFCVAITITFSRDRGSSAFASVIAYLVFCSIQYAFIQYDGSGNISSIMWFHKGETLMETITTTTLGFTTLQTSIFGGLIVGYLTSVIYNRISQVRVPKVLDFFSGVRLVPFVLIPAVALLAVFFLIFWPWIGQLINLIGKGIENAPYGTGGLLYGILGRALMPFGLHHIPIILAWQTPLGGTLYESDLVNALYANGADQEMIDTVVAAFGGQTSISGDQRIWNFLNGLPYNSFLTSDGGSLPVFQWVYKYLGVYAGRYMQDYPVYLGVAIGIGAAIIFTSSKENRKQVSALLGSAMLVAFLTGITEPLEYTFLFCAPLLYYLIYVPISGFSYMFMELVGAHIGVGFARGFIDLMIYGALPVMKGTNFWWAFVFAIGEGTLVGGLFYFCIKRFNIQTPGRGNNKIQLISKVAYQKNKENKNTTVDLRTNQIILALGGLNNIENVSACATRLRVGVKSSENIDKQNFKNLGSMGEVIKEKSLQIVFGGEATILSDKINYIIDNKIPIKEELGDVPNLTPTKGAKEINSVDKNHQELPFNIYAPGDGEVIFLNQCCDEAFREGLLGKGIVFIPKSQKIYAPINDGKIIDIHQSNHCFTLETKDQSKILFHLGIDSITLKESPFNLLSKKDQTINNNTLLLNLDLDKLKLAKSIESPIVLPELPPNRKVEILVKNHQIVKKGEILLKIT